MTTSEIIFHLSKSNWLRITCFKLSHKDLELCYDLECQGSFRSSHLSCSMKKTVFANLAKIHRKKSVLECLFIKVIGLQACNFNKKRLQQRCFPVNIAKFQKTCILRDICKRLLLIFERYISITPTFISSVCYALLPFWKLVTRLESLSCIISLR